MANLFLIIWRWNFTFTSGLKFLSDYIANISVKVKLDKTVRENLQESYFAFKSSNCPGDFLLRILKFMTVIQPSISTQELFCAWRCQKRKHWGRACLALGPRFKCYYVCLFWLIRPDWNCDIRAGNWTQVLLYSWITQISFMKIWSGSGAEISVRLTRIKFWLKFVQKWPWIGNQCQRFLMKIAIVVHL